MWIRAIVVAIGALLLPVLVCAQDGSQRPAQAPPSKPGCALHPSPDCVYFGVTDFGLAGGPRSRQQFSGDLHQTETNAEGGVMRNVGARNAIGATWFFKLADETVSTGPGVRYRRWLTKRQSVDLGLGVPLAIGDYERGTLFGLARYSPAPWIGFSARPERIRRNVFSCDSQRCGFESNDKFRLLAGADVTGRPGAVGLVAYGVAVGVVVSLLAISLGG
jgi:hypothetical protein